MRIVGIAHRADDLARAAEWQADAFDSEDNLVDLVEQRTRAS